MTSAVKRRGWKKAEKNRAERWERTQRENKNLTAKARRAQRQNPDELTADDADERRYCNLTIGCRIITERKEGRKMGAERWRKNRLGEEQKFLTEETKKTKEQE